MGAAYGDSETANVQIIKDINTGALYCKATVIFNSKVLWNNYMCPLIKLVINNNILTSCPGSKDY
jgi:hypothetical protein